MRYRLQFLVLTAVVVALLILIAHRSEGAAALLPQANVPALIYKIALLVFLGGTALTLLRGERFSHALASALVWVVFALVLVVGYSYRFELHEASDRIIAELIPGHVVGRGRSVEVARAMSGDFDLTARINGAPIAMVLDTGASSVVLSRADAKAAGLPIEVLDYNVPIETANGRTRAAQVTLDRIAVGGLVEHSVEALIVEPGQLKTSLLGMSFLNRLSSWEVRGDRLLLRGYP